jgi:hypothetical protein
MSQQDSKPSSHEHGQDSVPGPNLSAADEDIIQRALARIEELRNLKPVSDGLVKRVESELGVNTCAGSHDK